MYKGSKQFVAKRRVLFEVSILLYCVITEKLTSDRKKLANYLAWENKDGHILRTVRDNYNLNLHKYVYITTYQQDTKSNPNPTLLLKSMQ